MFEDECDVVDVCLHILAVMGRPGQRVPVIYID